MSSWRILLGGVASAGVLGVGVAAPTLARPVSHARDLATSSLTQVVPVSSLTGVVPVSSLTQIASASSLTRAAPASSLTRAVPSGSAARRVGCDLPGLPQAGLVVSALAGVLGAPCGSSDTPGRATSVLPRVPVVTSVESGLSAVTSAIPGLSAVTRVVPGPSRAGSVTGRPPGVGAVVGALSSLAGAFGGAPLGSPQP